MNKAVEIMKDGEARRWTTVGGYPIAYLDSDGEVLCPSCAKEQEEEEPGEALAGFINWEDPYLFCYCGDRIESAYADDVHQSNVTVYDGTAVSSDMQWDEDAVEELLRDWEGSLDFPSLESLIRDFCEERGRSKGYTVTVVLEGESHWFIL